MKLVHIVILVVAFIVIAGLTVALMTPRQKPDPAQEPVIQIQAPKLEKLPETKAEPEEPPLTDEEINSLRRKLAAHAVDDEERVRLFLQKQEAEQAKRHRMLLQQIEANRAAREFARNPFATPDRVRQFCQIADSVTDFKGEPEQGTFGYFPESKNRIVKVLSPGTAIVVLRKIPIPIGVTIESHVVIGGISMTGYDDKSTITLNMPFEVTGTKKIGDQTYTKLEAVPIYPVPMDGYRNRLTFP